MRLVDLALVSLVLAAAAGSAHAGPGGATARPAGSRAPKLDPKPDPKPDPQIDQADQLFAEGKALLSSNLLQACEKFEASLRINPAAIGTLLNVALCDEKLGKIASAVARFTEARDRAREQSLAEHLKLAEQHIAALAPSVPHLAIKLAEVLPDTKVSIDDTLVLLTQLGDIPIDPGERVIVVSAPERLPFHARLVIGRDEHRELGVPRLERSITVHSSQRRIGQLVTLTGAVVFGAGLGVGLYARDVYRKQTGPGGPCHDGLCSAEGQTQTERARTLGNVGTAIGALGAAAGLVGIYLWYSSPGSAPTDSQAPRLVLVPQVGADGLGVAAISRF